MPHSSGKNLQTFVATAVHALRSPLSRIYCAGQELRDNYGGNVDETGQFFMQSICEASEEVEDLLSSLSDLSRLYGIKPCLATLDLVTIASEEYEILRREAGSRDLRLLLPEAALVQADECLMRTALRELLANAVSFTSGISDAFVELRVIEVGAGWEICLCDNGVGFDSGLAERLFLPFQRLHRKQGLSGKGVGLAVVKAVASVHGGSVAAEGKVGEGATFKMFIPRQK